MLSLTLLPKSIVAKMSQDIDLLPTEMAKVTRALALHCLKLDDRPGEKGIISEMATKLVSQYPYLGTNAFEDRAVLIKPFYFIKNLRNLSKMQYLIGSDTFERKKKEQTESKVLLMTLLS